MSTKINDGGPAFPRDSKWNLDGSFCQRGTVGMSLRDWFAGQALNGMDISQIMEDAMNRGVPPERFERALTRAAYKIADDMIAARNNPPTPNTPTPTSHENQS